MWGTSGVHSFCVPRPFYIHSYGDNALLRPARPAEWNQLYLHNEYQLKIRSFFYQGQVAPSSGDDPTRSYSPSKTTILDAFFVFLQQKVEIAVFCLGYQTRSMVEAQKSPLHVSFFDIRTSIVSFLVLSATRLARYKGIFKNYQQTCQAILFHL